MYLALQGKIAFDGAVISFAVDEICLCLGLRGVLGVAAAGSVCPLCDPPPNLVSHRAGFDADLQRRKMMTRMPMVRGGTRMRGADASGTGDSRSDADAGLADSGGDDGGSCCCSCSVPLLVVH